MSFHGYIAERFLSDIDAFTPEQQYRILYDLPDDRYVAPEVKYRMFCKGEKASEALKHVRRLLPMPFSPNTLSPKLYKELSLIDHERWDEAGRRARAELQSRGVWTRFGGKPKANGKLRGVSTLRLHVW
ncbi:hypothetical protein CC77DRAFT_1025857 [Alternaria alternata]|uniref:Uncharacterized protein n=1 Tax=Alternaria alternata TaxID=5599 RepID=A0A177D4W8_ALTAL|nr:hypothetical protein CC77DRAFT_1025857 [Alternaria alternata]OAG14451.1 hypothetical protein CC77DRAFT_1025857 [Alternaria alternata]